MLEKECLLLLSQLAASGTDADGCVRVKAAVGASADTGASAVVVSAVVVDVATVAAVAETAFGRLPSDILQKSSFMKI